MKRFSAPSLSALCLLAAMFSFNACQKEGVFYPDAPVGGATTDVTADRAANHITYGVTLFSNTSPSQIVGVDQATGNAMAPVNAFYIDNVGNTINLTNLKGICLTSWGQYFLTTGSPATSIPGFSSVYDNALYKVNPVTGQCSYFASVCPSGSVSDLEYDPNSGLFYGLLNNTNAILNISNGPGGNPTVYSAPAAITGIAGGYTLKGLTLVRDNVGGAYFVGCATRPGNAPAKLYNIPAAGGLAVFLTDLDPLTDFSGGHCALGFDLDLNHLEINRAASNLGVVSGLSEIDPWTGIFAPTTTTNFWGAAGVNFEDLTSSVY